MFHSKSSSTPAAPDGLSARALNASTVAAQNAQAAAQAAAQSAAQAAQAAAQTAASRVAPVAQTAAARVAPVAQTAAARVAPVAQTAAARVAPAAQTAAHGMGRSMRQGVHSARGWTAPRLEEAADYCTDTVAPRVAAALRSTARQVRPDDAKGKPSLRSVLSVSVLAVATLAAAGAVAVLVRRQYKAAMEADTESDVMDIEDRDEPGTARREQASASAQAGSPDEPLVTDQGTGAGRSGRKSTSGW